MHIKKSQKLGLISALGLFTAAPGSAGLIAYYPLDDTTGDTATATFGIDASWDNPGNNLTWEANGKVGGAAVLGGTGGSNNHFKVDLGGLLNSDKMTVALWINPLSGNNYEGVFMTRANHPDGTRGPTTLNGGGNGNWGLAWEGGARIDARANGAIDTPDGGIVVDDTDAGSDENGWYHVAWVWNGELGEHRVYINGAEAGASTTAVIDTLRGGIWHLGNDSCCNGRDFNGLMDDLGVWDEALSAQDIADLASLTKSPDDINPPEDPDGDGLPTSYENQFPGFLDPLVDDADQDVDTEDGTLDGTPQPDGLTNAEELAAGTDPTLSDTDGDGILDGEELILGEDNFITDPLKEDVDSDGLTDGEETSMDNGFITDPNKVDTDGDTFTDKDEIENGTDPTDAADPPLGPLPSQGLVVLYRFDETEGTVATDSAVDDGANDAETAQGVPTWNADGLVGGALDLDGTSSLSVQNILPVGTPALSISGWVNPRSINDYKGVFASRADANWGLNVRNNGNRADLRFQNTGNGSIGIPTEEVILDEWVHLAITWSTDGFEAVGKAYFNGRLINTLSTADGADIAVAYANPGTWNIGDDTCCGGRELDGLIDEVSVWNVALSDEDISNIYRNGVEGIGLTPPTSKPFIITSIERAETGDVTLTFNSRPGATYTLRFNNTLNDDPTGWPDLNDGVASEGDSTTITVTAAELGGEPKIFFALTENGPGA
ncbi:MAG: LamG-like jellyroll fold domain-containing protein [Akkermansiaceae bacterium]